MTTLERVNKARAWFSNCSNIAPNALFLGICENAVLLGEINDEREQKGQEPVERLPDRHYWQGLLVFTLDTPSAFYVALVVGEVL